MGGYYVNNASTLVGGRGGSGKVVLFMKNY
jgi:hypothetical protein